MLALIVRTTTSGDDEDPGGTGSALAFLLQTEPDFDVVDVADLSLERDLPQLKKEALSQRPSVRIQSKVVELNEKAGPDDFFSPDAGGRPRVLWARKPQ